jgi:hypothetical protein
MARTRRTRPKRKSTRRTSARRTSTKRARKSAKRSGPKGLRLSRKAQKQILIAVAIVVGILLLIGLLQNTRTYVQKRWYAGEVGRNVVYGRVTSVAIGAAGRGAIRVQSFNTGKIYTFYTGLRTDYSPRRYPYAGERAKVYYINDRGYLKATYIRLR